MSSHGGYMTYRSYALVFIALLSAVLIAALAMVSESVDKNKGVIESPGMMSAYISWDDGDHDVDMWVKSPDDEYPVGYQRTHGVSWDLVRDDLGSYSDNDKNFENAFNRTMPAGEYVIAIHCFDCTVKLPLHVNVQVLITRATVDRPEEVVSTTVELTKLKQEKTVIRFWLDDTGHVIREKTSRLCKPLKEVRCS